MVEHHVLVLEGPSPLSAMRLRGRGADAAHGADPCSSGCLGLQPAEGAAGGGGRSSDPAPSARPERGSPRRWLFGGPLGRRSERYPETPPGMIGCVGCGHNIMLSFMKKKKKKWKEICFSSSASPSSCLSPLLGAVKSIPGTGEGGVLRWGLPPF